MTRWLATLSQALAMALAATALADGGTTRPGGAAAEVIGPVRYTCGDDPADRLLITFFRTDPPRLIAERGGRTIVMVLQPSGSGAKYAGSGATFWEHHGEAMLNWGEGDVALRCVTTD